MEATTTTTPPERRTRLERPTTGRVLGGVATALANATGIAVAAVRLAFVVSLLFGGLGIVLYAAAWALIPGEGDDRSTPESRLGDLTIPSNP